MPDPRICHGIADGTSNASGKARSAMKSLIILTRSSTAFKLEQYARWASTYGKRADITEA